MPAPIPITANEQNWIKQYLQETYDVTIVDAFDCQKLSEAIANQNGIKISYSTFRRLFNLVPNTNAQSRFVLNALAVVVGFKNWEEFKQHVSSYDTNDINQNIQIYSRQLPGSSALILETIKKLPITTRLGGYQLQSIITLALEHQDFELLKEVMQIPFDINNQNIYEHLVIGFQSLYFHSLKNNQAVINFVKQNINTSVLLQKCLLQAYVDEKQLNSFLRVWLNAVHQSEIPDLILFKNLLLCQKSYDNNDISIAKIYLSTIQELVSNHQFVIHPILKARIGVWERVLNKNEAPLINYFNSLSNPFEKTDFAVIASRLLWIYNDEKPIAFLEQLSLKEFPTVKDFFQKGRYNVLLLTLAIHYYLKQDLPKSKEYLYLFDANKLGFDIVNVDFYYTWLKKLR